MERRRRILLVTALVVSLIVGSAGAIWGAYTVRTRQIYTQKIAAGDRYLEANDYDNAILMYQQAIRKDSSKDQGYVKLANAYISQGNMALAVSTLEEGYEKTGSDRIRRMLAVYRNFQGGENGGKKELALNRALIGKLGGTRYGDYTKRDEVESVTAGPSGEVTVRLKGIPADLVYRNSTAQPGAVSGGKVQDMAYPDEIYFDNLTVLLGTTGTVSYDDLRTLEFNNIEILEGGETGYQIRMIYLGSTILAPCDKDGTVSADSRGVMTISLNSEDLNNSDQSDENLEGTKLWGRIEDAQSGSGLAGVTVYIYESGRRNDEPLATVETDDNGEYSVNLEEGFYVVVLDRNGYVSTEKEVYIGSYSGESEEDFVMSQESAGEIRIVLEWDSPACDLDSYLADDGDWMMFNNKEIYRGGELAASLDRDARSGHGVETTTVYDMEGSYSFMVYDFMDSGQLQQSGATVTIYEPGRDPQVISIPSDAGNLWNVCDIDAGKVTVTNYMSEVQASYGSK